MKKGQGFARRITPENMTAFKPLLTVPDAATPGGPAAAKAAGAAAPPDLALAAAKALFKGESVRWQVPFKRPTTASPGGSKTLSVPAATPQFGKLIEVVEAPSPVIAGLPDVLFAEIPAGASRWNQANFDQENFIRFFRANTPGSLTMWHVDDNAAIKGEPPRPGVSVKSRNFRIELAAAAGKKYPTKGAPIGVFLPVATKEFYYMLLMPGDTHYQSARDILSRHAKVISGRRKRVRIAGSTAMQEWPNSPLWIAYKART